MMDAVMTPIEHRLTDGIGAKGQMEDFDRRLSSTRQCITCSQHKPASDYPLSFRKSAECSVCVLLKKSGFDCMPRDAATNEPVMEERTPPSPAPVARLSSMPKTLMKRLSWTTASSRDVTAQSSDEDQTPPGSPSVRHSSLSPTIAKSFIKKRFSWNSSAQPEAAHEEVDEHHNNAPVARRASLPSQTMPKSIKKRMSWTTAPAAPEMVTNDVAHYC